MRSDGTLRGDRIKIEARWHHEGIGPVTGDRSGRMQLDSAAVVVDRAVYIKGYLYMHFIYSSNSDARCNMRHQGECERPTAASASRYRNRGASSVTGSLSLVIGILLSFRLIGKIGWLGDHQSRSYKTTQHTVVIIHSLVTGIVYLRTCFAQV